MLEVLRWDLSSVTPYCILDQLLRRLPGLEQSGFSPALIRRHAETFLAVAATDFGLTSSAASPATVAISCLLAACNGMKRDVAQERQVRKLLADLAALAGASESDVLTCMEAIEECIRERLPTLPQSAPLVPLNNNNNGGSKASSANASPNANGFCVSNSPTDVVDMSVACV